jgi:AraC-like DNA-binding protein
VESGKAHPGPGPDFFSTQVSEARRFYLDLDPPQGRGLTVVSGGCELCAPDYEIHRRGFRYFSVEFVARGKGTLVLKGNTHVLGAGTVFSYGPGISQDIATDPKDRLVKYFVDFTSRGAAALLRRAGVPPGKVIRSSSPAEIAAIFDDLIRNGIQGTRFSPAICVAIVEQLLLKIAETILPGGTAGTLAFATYQRVRQLIEEHHLRLRTLGQIAHAARLDPAYLCRLFRRHGHQSPYQLLLRLKMRHAADRLHATGAMVKEVAAELGFKDPYHFSRAFKRVYGLSPRRLVELRGRG